MYNKVIWKDTANKHCVLPKGLKNTVNSQRIKTVG